MIELFGAFFSGVVVTALAVFGLTRIARKRYEVVEKENYRVRDNDRRDNNRHPKG